MAHIRKHSSIFTYIISYSLVLACQQRAHQEWNPDASGMISEMTQVEKANKFFVRNK